MVKMNCLSEPDKSNKSEPINRLYREVRVSKRKSPLVESETKEMTLTVKNIFEFVSIPVP